MRSHAAKIGEDCAYDVTEVIEREASPYFTQNLHYLQSTYLKWLALYQRARRDPSHYRVILDAEDDDVTLGQEDQCSFEGVRVPYISAAPSPSRSQYEDPIATILRLLALHGFGALTAADLARLQAPDPFEDELHVMADVRAYFRWHIRYLLCTYCVRMDD